MTAQTDKNQNLDLAAIGNCTFSGLINKKGRIVWACMPHFDDEPVFCDLINSAPDKAPEDDWGYWEFELLDFERSEQSYISNTAVVVTTLYDRDGGSLEIIDFAPRYAHYGRYFKPPLICRLVKPLTGTPRIKVRLKPRFDYGATAAEITCGSNHIRYVSPDEILRLTTDAPISYIEDEVPFLLDRGMTFLLGPDEPVLGNVEATGRKYKENTIRYWRGFSRGLTLPFEWQDEVIRAAITLKLCTFEETGAVLAALTTSIPESPDSGRNFDYRFCWLRDALFVVNAMNRLGITRTMEDYLRYIMNISILAEEKFLQPLYGLKLQEHMEEIELEHLSGFLGMGPVRQGNHAYGQMQHDVWGSVILALTQAFFDKRLVRPGNLEDFHRLEKFGESAIKYYNKPDAGIWEFREKGRVHTFSSVMCWVACDRLAKIAIHIGLDDRAAYWRDHAETIHAYVMDGAWNEDMQSLVEPLDGNGIDASLLLLPEVGFIDAKDPKFVKTVERIEKELMREGLLYRYTHADDFGTPEVAFTVCTFWYIDALAAMGREKEAREKFEFLLSRRNHVGLLSEDMDFESGELWGNFPQTYSMVGLINSALRLSKSWREAL